jgi:fermentation-respiration switch protein FrsA (DUF1100 family)
MRMWRVVAGVVGFAVMGGDVRADGAPAKARFAPDGPALRKAYERAGGLRQELQGRVFKDRIELHWFHGDDRFWYRNDTRGGHKEFVLVDAAKGTRAAAFDHARLADALSKAAKTEIAADRLPFDTIRFGDDMKTVRFHAAGADWSCDLSSYECTKPQPAPAPEEKAAARASDPPARESEPEPVRRGRPPFVPEPRGLRSPDGKWAAEVRDYNVVVRPWSGGEESVLSRNGQPDNAYGSLTWSPDSKTLVAFRTEPATRKEVYKIESSPREGGRAKLHTTPYELPGDRVPIHEVWLFDVEAKTSARADVDRIDFGGVPRLRWREGGRVFTFEKTDRGHQRFRVVEVEAKTGKTRNLIDERSETFVDGYSAPYLRYLDRSEEILYKSERDGWAHLYLFDAKGGSVKAQLTKGEWVVRGVDRVDEEKRQVWFRASGKNPGQDPYFIQYYRVNLDGTDLVALTEGDGSHVVQYSPERKYLVDTYSRVDMAPIHELRRVSDGALVCPLERADVSALEETGWVAPEVFHAKGRDGATDVWGVVYRPRGLDPSKAYPVIEDIYAGPHGAFVPKTFIAFRRTLALAELGFIVVQVDGMGSAFRSKAFHDVCWKNVGDAGLPDRILWIKALAAKYPYVDATRVGVYGTSAGGQSSTGALLFHPDFYKVAVSSCGCHDNRMDKSSWNEVWMGYPVGPHYAEQSNVTNAHKLRGKLLLIVGELDANVPPESTMRLADALIKANKDFDLLFVPGMGHSDGGLYGERRRRDFFVRHLHGVEPPDRNAAGTEAGPAASAGGDE